ncbi:hypothetical protein DPMN_091707 [Dreissena polymorpha]|uniref:Uncharacterized protein n=1 Tax=Dreissena polymorpha TaxID=45954 RepID=A0A9D4L007_DREPO|nr:hypothetical protein DPMN_091707 [Dreissena polymorpha]
MGLIWDTTWAQHGTLWLNTVSLCSNIDGISMISKYVSHRLVTTRFCIGPMLVTTWAQHYSIVIKHRWSLPSPEVNTNFIDPLLVTTSSNIGSILFHNGQNRELLH